MPGTGGSDEDHAGRPSTFEDLTDQLPLLRFLGARRAEPSAPDVVVSMTMEITPDVVNLAGNPHGGAIASLIDHAGGLAVGVALGHSGPTADLHVRYLRPARGRRVTADARVLRAGRRLAVVEVRVSDDLGALTAIGTMTTAPRPDGPVADD